MKTRLAAQIAAAAPRAGRNIPVKSASQTPVAECHPEADAELLLDATRSRLLRRLGSTLRHDLNSPLQAALWAFDLLERGVTSHPDAEQRAKLLTSVQLGRRELARLQQAVRLFVGCAAPLDEMTESFDVRDVLAEVESLVGADASLRDVQIEFRPQAERLAVNGVRYQVQQALLLLTLEALDATGAGGSVEVEPAPAEGLVQVQVSHRRNGATDVVSTATDLARRVVEAVAVAHGGSVSRHESTGRCETRLVLRPARNA